MSRALVRIDPDRRRRVPDKLLNLRLCRALHTRRRGGSRADAGTPGLFASTRRAMMTLARLATARHCASTAFTARGAAHRAGTAAARLPARSVRVSAARWRPGDGTEDEEAREKAPTEALIDAMDSAAKLRNRDSGGKVTTVMGSDAGAGGLGANMTWKELDERVNEYPSDRKFQAIGEGGDAFVAEVVGLVEGALGRPVDPAQVTSRPSKKGKYVSANVVAQLENGEEVVAVYAALKACEKVVWYL